MPKGYIVARIVVTNPQAYAEYVKDASEAIRQYGGTPLARGGAFEQLEGEARPRNVVIGSSRSSRPSAIITRPSIRPRSRSAKRRNGRHRRGRRRRVIQGVLDRPRRRGRRGGLQRYLALNGVAFAKFGGRFLVRGGPLRRGDRSSRQRKRRDRVPVHDTAMECYRSPEYQAAVAARDEGAEVDLIIIEGYDGPQPAGGRCGSSCWAPPGAWGACWLRRCRSPPTASWRGG
jgi:uncharacterized protein (DUF1330 family)